MFFLVMRAVGIATKTLLRWLKQPAFDTEYRKARRAAFDVVLLKMQSVDLMWKQVGGVVSRKSVSLSARVPGRSS
jgi:hypothetical protein